METQIFFENFTEGVKAIVGMADWAFIVAFMIWVWITGMTKISSKVKVKWIQAIPRAYFVITQGIVLAAIWAWLFDFSTKEQFAELFVSILVGMVVWKLGLSKIGAKLQDKVVK